MGQRRERQGDRAELQQGGRHRHIHHRPGAPLGTDHRQGGLYDRDQQRQDQGEMAQFRNHGLALAEAPGASAAPGAAAR